MLEQAERGTPEYWSSEDPDRVAVISGDQRMTYAEWNDRSNRVADALAAKGLKAGDRIGMRFRLGFAWFVVQRALQKLGVVQVAVNWKLTPSEAAYILEDSGAAGLACDDADVSDWGNLNVGILLTVGQSGTAPGFRYEDLIAEGAPVPRFGTARADFILYTSGTTGKPKGVPPATVDPANARKLLNYFKSMSSVPRHPERPTILLSMPVHHGAGPAAARVGSQLGGSVVLLDPYDPQEALRLIEKHRVQVWTTVPTMLLRIQALPEAVFSKYDVSSMESLTTGAAPVPHSLKTWIIHNFGDDVLWEGYGCSEAGMLTFMKPEDQLRKPGSSGTPYAEVEIRIVDDHWNPLDPGVTGEIAANTPIVLKNYLGRPDLDEETIKDGFYRTGDVGHMDEDGYLYITDRIKDMIVAGGVNIYPAEIEGAILAHPDVENCAVIGVPQDDFGEQILALVVVAPGKSLSEAALAAFLESDLAKFKRPRQYRFVDELPLNPTGKVQKNELRAPYWEGRERNV